MGAYKSTLALLLILLISITSVNAFWWLFKSGTKQTEKQIIKQGEKAETKQVEKTAIKQEDKTALKQEQIQVNRITGNTLDDAFKQKWCQTRKCGTSVDELRKTLKPVDTIYITSDWEAKRYINEKFDSSFTRRPDMLEVNVVNRNIKNIKIYDTKTSADAIISADVRGQGDDYDKLCNSLNVKYGRNFCAVQYVLPKDEAEQVAKSSGNSVLGCLAIGLIMIPDPTDLLCFVAS